MSLPGLTAWRKSMIILVHLVIFEKLSKMLIGPAPFTPTDNILMFSMVLYCILFISATFIEFYPIIATHFGINAVFLLVRLYSWIHVVHLAFSNKNEGILGFAEVQSILISAFFSDLLVVWHMEMIFPMISLKKARLSDVKSISPPGAKRIPSRIPKMVSSKF